MAESRLIECTIYGLASSNKPNDIRYIGQTTETLKKRLINHRAKSKRANYPVCCWIRKHEKLGDSILIHKLQDGIWNKTEEEILATCKENGYDLLNCTDGGKGSLGHSWKLGKKARKNISNGHKGIKLSDAHKNAISKGNKGKKRSKEYVMKVTERMTKVGPPKGGLQKGDTHSIEARNKISKSLSGKPKSEEHKLKLKQAALKRWAKNKGN